MTGPAPEVQTPTKEIRVEELPPKDESKAVARIEHPFVAPTAGLAQIPAAQEFSALMEMADMLVKSQFLPKAINTGPKALAIILAGRELGMPPMLALRSIHIIEGKPVLAADSLLGAFKRAGGRAKFGELSEKRAELWLKHPNGDEHTETFTWEMATKAQLINKDNWKKFPQAMLRSRVITAGLKSLGWEPAAGVYDPEELESLSEATGGFEEHGGAQQSGSAQRSEPAKPEQVDPQPVTFPFAPRKGVALDARYPDDHADEEKRGQYQIDLELLAAAHKWASEALEGKPVKGKKDQPPAPIPEDRKPQFRALVAALEAEFERRGDEARAAAPAGSEAASGENQADRVLREGRAALGREGEGEINRQFEQERDKNLRGLKRDMQHDDGGTANA